MPSCSGAAGLCAEKTVDAVLRASEAPVKRLATRRRIAALAACLVLLAVVLAACSDVRMPGESAQATLGGACPVPSPNLLPAAWRAEGQGTLINIDGDEDLECLVIYRYNTTGDNTGLLGGLVFDPQVGADEKNRIVTYRLLPWTNPVYSISDVPTYTLHASWPERLGALGQKKANVLLYDTDQNNQPDELGILGYDWAGIATTLSLYRWRNLNDGLFLVGYFHGNAGVEIINPPQPLTSTIVYKGPVHTVRTTDRLYDRSGLAVRYQYERKGELDESRFDYRSNWVDFVGGRPRTACYFPEGQTLVYYNNMNRPVFDLRLFSENAAAGEATVCAGTWDVQATVWRRYWALVDLKRQPGATVGVCDEWTVLGERPYPKSSCTP